MKRSLLVLAVVALACALAAQNPTPVPVSKEPRHHLVLENDKVRIYDVTVAVGDQTLLHQHDIDYVFVTLGDSDVENRVLGRPPVELKLEDGEARFAKGGFAHVAVNKAQTPFHNITIEILPTQPSGMELPALPLGAGMTVEPVFDQKVVRCFSFTLEPGAVMPLHEHKTDHLVVMLTDAHLKSDVVGKGSSDITPKRGDPVFVRGGYSHTLTNVGSTPARFVEIEFK